MSIPAVPTTLGTTKQLPPGRYGMGALMRSEWTKLRSLRSTMWTLGITVVLGIGISALATAETRVHWSSMSPGNRLSFDPTSVSLIGVFFGQLTIGVLGVLVMSGEYGSGTIRASFSAAPRRPLVLAAKAAVFGLVALVVAEIVSFLSYFLGQALLERARGSHDALEPGGAPGGCRQRDLSLPDRAVRARTGDDDPSHGRVDQCLPRDPPRRPDPRPRPSQLARERDREVHARPDRVRRRLPPPGGRLRALDRTSAALRLRGRVARRRWCAPRPPGRVRRTPARELTLTRHRACPSALSAVSPWSWRRRGTRG